MRIVDPARLEPPVESVAAFACDPAELGNRLNAIDLDQFSAPGPARLGAIELSDSSTVGIVIHEHGKFAEVLAQLSTSIDSALVEVFRLLDVAPADIQRLREGYTNQPSWRPLQTPPGTMIGPACPGSFFDAAARAAAGYDSDAAIKGTSPTPVLQHRPNLRRWLQR